MKTILMGKINTLLSFDRVGTSIKINSNIPQKVIIRTLNFNLLFFKDGLCDMVTCNIHKD